MPEFLQSIINFFVSTQVPTQLTSVDAAGLFSNPWFLVPLLGLLGYWIYKKAWSSCILLGVGFGVWIFTGSRYMREIMKDGELQINNIAPVIGVGLLAVGIVVYVFFIRSD